MWGRDDVKALLRRIDEHSDNPNAAHEVIALCGKALDLLSRHKQPELWGLVHQYRGTALVRLGEIAGDPALMADAVVAFQLALEVLDPNDNPVDWAGITQNRANALVRLGEFKGDPQILQSAVADFDTALRVFTREASPGHWAMAQMNRATALFRIGELSGDLGALRSAVAGCDNALQVFTREAAPPQWAMAQSNKANALLRIGRQTGDPKLLLDTARIYAQALEVRTREAAPEQWALTQQNRAIALQSLGELNGDQTAFRGAVSAFEASLSVYTLDASPARWAGAQQNIAVTFTRLGELSGEPGDLYKAVAACDAALKVRRRQTNLAEWAMTQQNRANALLKLGELQTDVGILREAVAGCDLALEVRTRLDSPAEWATILVNRAQARIDIGELLGDPSLYDAAIEDYDAALAVFTRDANPPNWAMAQHSRANALQGIALLRADATVLNSAVAGYEAALEFYTRDANPAQWAKIQQDRANSLLRLGELSGDDHALRAAVAGYDTTLLECDRIESPALWAMTTQNRASALGSLGASLQDPDMLRAAIAGTDAALQIRTRDASPGLWATTLHNQGTTYQRLYQLTGDPGALAAAIAAWEATLGVWTMETAPDLCMASSAGLANILFEHRWIDKARARLDAALGGGLGHLRTLKNRAARERAVEQAAGLAELRAWIAIAIDGDAAAALLWIERGRAQLLSLVLAEDAESAVWPRQSALEELLGAIPVGGAAVIPIVTPAGTRVAVIPAGRNSIGPGDFLDLPELTREAIAIWLFGDASRPEEISYLVAYHGLHASEAAPIADRLNYFADVVRLTMARTWTALLASVDDRLRELAIAPRAPVVIVPTGLLSLLPLWASTPDSGQQQANTPFGERWTVSFAPCLSVLAIIRRRAADWERRGYPISALAVLDPASADQVRLPGAAREAEILKQFAGPERVQELAGLQASREAVHNALAGRTHAHFSAHGFYSPERPDLSAILLAGDDRLTLGDLQQIEAIRDLRLVMLSACDTGLAGLQRGKIDEFIGLPAGFLQAGAAAVIASHWPVGDDAAYFLVWKFYEAFWGSSSNSRHDPASALRFAGLWLRDVTVGELLNLFEPVRDDEGIPIPGVIDRNRPRGTSSSTSGLAEGAFQPSDASAPQRGAVSAAQNGRRDAPRDDRRFSQAQHRAIAANRGAYVFRDVGADHRPFANPAFWAAFSITGI